MPEQADIEKLHAKVDAVSMDLQWAKGMLKATLGLCGLAQAVLVPMIAWNFNSVLTLREESVATKIRLERVEYKCGESHSLSSIARPLQTASRRRLNDSSKSTKPAVSALWDTTTSLSLLDCD